jgi:hypothetical protein
MKLQTLSQEIAICRLGPETPTPGWAVQGKFYSITRTPEELSIVCDQLLVPEGIKVEKGWRVFKVVGTLDFSLTGILSSIANPLAEAKISIFALSTFDTDFVLVKSADLEEACKRLCAVGFVFV